MGNIGKTKESTRLNINASIAATWVQMIQDAGFTPHVQFAPGLTARSISGFPPGFIPEMLDETTHHSGLREKMRKAKKSGKKIGYGFVLVGEYAHATKMLNVGYRAAKLTSFDTEDGYLYLDIRFQGVVCPNIAIPIECIVDVYAKENSDFGAMALGMPILGVASTVVEVNDGELNVRSIIDMAEPQTAEVSKPILGIVGGTAHRPEDKPEQAVIEPESESENPDPDDYKEDAGVNEEDAIEAGEKIVSLAAARARLRKE